MATTDNLGAPSIVPAARPLATFFQPLQPQVAGATQRQRVQGGAGLSIQSTASGGSVEGYYTDPNPAILARARADDAARQAQGLIQALAPFSEALMQVTSKGVELYASGEYQKGQAEALEAYSRADQQLDQGELTYAYENRELARQSPMAALAMDEANPYRRAGRLRQLTQLAGGEVNRALRSAYRQNAGTLATYESDDPRINELRAQVVQDITDRFGINPYSPGYAESFLNPLNQAWDWVSNQQFSDRQGYLKAAVPGLAATGLYGQASNMLDQGATSAQVGQSLQLQLDDVARRFGIPAEGMEAKQEIIKTMLQQAQIDGRVELIDALTGQAMRAGITSVELFKLEEGIDSTLYTRQNRADARVREAFSEALIEGAGGAATPQEVQGLAVELYNSGQFPGLTMAGALNAARDVASTFDALNPDDTTEMDVFLLGLEDTYGDAWSSPDGLQQLEEEFMSRLGALRDPEKRQEAIRQFGSIRQRKKEETSRLDSQVESSINSKIRAAIAQAYPGLQASILQGAGDAEALMAYGKQAEAASWQKQKAAYRKAAYMAVAEAERIKRAPLSTAEKEQVVQDSLAKYTPANFPDLFPTAQGLQGQAKPAAPAAPAQSNRRGAAPGTQQKPKAPVTYGVGQLDQMGDREKLLGSYRTQPILRPESAQAALGQAMSGSNGLFSPALVRAAQDAGTDPGSFLLAQLRMLRTADGKPAVVIPKAAEQELIRRGRKAAAQSSYAGGRQANAGNPNPVQAAGGWALNAITGIIPGVGLVQRGLVEGLFQGRPAGAAELPPARFEPIAMRRDSQPPAPPTPLPAPTRRRATPSASRPAATQLSVVEHAETGRGFTAPGMRDASNRPVVLSRPAMAAFQQMVMDSGNAVKPSDVTSSQRSPAHNAQVRGATGSLHLDGSAMDIHGTSIAWIRKHGKRYGWVVNDYPGSHGGHVEFVGPSSGDGGSKRSSTGAGPLPGFRRQSASRGYLGPTMQSVYRLMGWEMPPELAQEGTLKGLAPRPRPGITMAPSTSNAGNMNTFLSALAFLESDNGKNPGNGGGPFQFLGRDNPGAPVILTDAVRRYGLSRGKLLAGDYGEVAKLIQRFRPKAYEAILQGDWNTAIEQLKDTWVSLPGSKYLDQKQSQARIDRFWAMLRSL